jgi:alkylation response protein AidB-like acyl-CoA dehydrogenase
MTRSQTSTPGSADGSASWRAWLAERLPPRRPAGGPPTSRAIFVDRTEAEERALITEARAWQSVKYDAGLGALTWDHRWGGAGLPPEQERAFARLEQEFAVPQRHDLLEVTVSLVAPPLRDFGDPHQHQRYIRAFLRADELCCQLFSEPGAGSDLAAAATRARRSDGGWIVDGQKVWTSGAQHADWGFLIARTDPDAPKHRGLSAFLVRLDDPGIMIRPIRQMTGGSSFNEVFLSGVTVPDDQRIGEPGDGWRVALTLLGYERAVSGDLLGTGGRAADLVELARRTGALGDPVLARRVGEALVREQCAALLGRRRAERLALGEPGAADGSVGKLVWSQNLTLIGDVAAELLGPRICADTGIDDTYAWSEHLLGAPGYRIAGGSDEIQRTIIGERGLGLPREPH